MDEVTRSRRLAALAVIDRLLDDDHAQAKALMSSDDNPQLLSAEVIAAFTVLLRGLLCDRRQLVLSAFRAELVRR